MHMHLVSFQILDRQAIDETTGEPTGPLLQPAASEKGWKDTANSPTGYRTRVIARFDGFTGTYPYHCHILEHEDHEMMRQFEVMPCQIVTNTLNAGPGSLRYAIECAESGDTIRFRSGIANDTIHLDAPITLDKDLIIENTHLSSVIIDASTTSQLFHISPDTDVTLKKLTLLSGDGLTGRAIANYGVLTLDEMTIKEHPSLPFGNVILNSGQLEAKGSCQLVY